MIKMEFIEELICRMISFDAGDPKRIQHFIKVYEFARLIGKREELDEHTQFVLEAAAVLHDIGIHPAEEKFGSCEGRLQEQEGPAPARKLLEEMACPAEDIDRICYLIGHHHTYTNVDGSDYRILLEADFLVNLYEDDLPEEAVLAALSHVFRTESGTRLCREIFLGKSL